MIFFFFVNGLINWSKLLKKIFWCNKYHCYHYYASVISWWWDLLVEESGVPGEYNRQNTFFFTIW